MDAKKIESIITNLTGKEKKQIKGKRKIASQVFDESTLDTLQRLGRKQWIHQLKHSISTGKEGNVFLATNESGNIAVKIYKIETSRFKRMQEYIEGDQRFKKTKHTKREIVNTWVQKEFQNLNLAKRINEPVPTPFAYLNNILVMEFIGTGDEAAPTLKQCPPKDPQLFFDKTISFIANLFYNSKLVHADLSGFNILNKNENPVFIDMGQAVLITHPKAIEFLKRDVANICHYFKTLGVETDEEESLKKIREFGKNIKK